MALYDGNSGSGLGAAPIHPGLLRLLHTRRAGGVPTMRARPTGPRQAGGGRMPFDIEQLRRLIQQHLGGGLDSPIYPGGSPNPEPHRPIGDQRHDYIPPGAPPLANRAPGPIDTIHNIGDLSNYGQSMQNIGNDPNALGGYQDPMQTEEGGHGDLRENLLNRFRQSTPALTSRAALMRFLQQQSPRRAVQRQRPILPQRPPLRARPVSHPY